MGRDGLATNHYLCNLLGLQQLGCALAELHEAERWRQLAWALLQREMERQVLDDGVDYERSIPYHRLATEVFLHAALLARASGDDLPTGYLARLERMLEFVTCYTRPDGSCPQWGDNDDGRVLPLEGYASHAPHDHRHLLALGGALLNRDDLLAAGRPHDVEALWALGDHGPSPEPRDTTGESRGFPDAGYYILRAGDLHCCVPCGPEGTAGMGNHSHNDLLSVCVWAGAVEWITDPGTGGYTGDPALRNRLRATAAHATLQLGEREQNPFAPGVDDLFVLREAAHPEVLAWEPDGPEPRLVARHRGFGGSMESCVHERAIVFRPTRREWRLHDRLTRQPATSEDTTSGEDVFLRFPT